MNVNTTIIAAMLLLCLGATALANITIETVTVGDPSNPADTTAFGSVGYVYQIGKYEVTAAQYTAFLNAVAMSDPYGLYNQEMWTHDLGCKIQRSGEDGNYSYSVAPEYANRPVNFVSFWDSCRFANWLHNGQGDGSTETGAYILKGYTGSDGRGVRRLPTARWSVATEGEWYKAAFYRGGSTNAGYWSYPTQSNTIDTSKANYANSVGHPIDVGSYAYPGPYGTYDQGGNVWERTESLVDQFRVMRGGSFTDAESRLSSSYRIYAPPAWESHAVGFRVVYNPDPPKPPRHDFPRVGEYEVLSGDFHIHTTMSDGTLSVEDRIMESYWFGYDVIAITDHGMYDVIMEGGLVEMMERAVPITDSLGMVMICGMETGIHSSGREHIIALGMDPSIYVPADEHAWAEQPGGSREYYRDRMADVAAAGGVLVYAHPHSFTAWDPATQGMRGPILWGVEQGYIIGVEAKNYVVTLRTDNAWNTIESHGAQWYPFTIDWALEHNLAIFAGSDIHRDRTHPQPVTLVLAADRTSSGVMDAIRGRRTIAWFRGMLWGREALLSDLMDAVVTVRRSDAEPGVLVLENAGSVALQAVIQGAGDEAIELPAYAETSVEMNNTLDRIEVRWANIWINLSENLQSTYDLGSVELHEAKLLPDGTAVGLHGVQITALAGVGAPADADAVTGGIPDGVGYIQSADRSSAIRITLDQASNGSIHWGDTVSLRGVMGTLPTGERFIAVGQVSAPSHTRPIDAVAMSNRSIQTDELGQGLFVRTTGKVLENGSGYFTITDGSGTLLKVMCGTLAQPAVGQDVRVRGVVSTDGEGAVLLMRNERVDWVDLASEVQPLPLAGAVKAVRDYLLLEPFPDLSGSGDSNVRRTWMLNHDYIAQFSSGAVTETTVRPSAGDRAGNRTWYRSDGLSEIVHPPKGPFPDYGHVTTYAHIYVWSPTEQTVDLLIGAADACKAWVNGELQVTTQPATSAVYGLERVAVTLGPGENSVLMKLVWTLGEYAFVSQFAQPNTWMGPGWGNSAPAFGLGYLLNRQP
jgi:formylglycine-generating enzyme